MTGEERGAREQEQQETGGLHRMHGFCFVWHCGCENVCVHACVIGLLALHICYTYTCVCVCVRVCVHVCVYIYVNICSHGYMYMYMCMYVYVYTCIYICIYIYIYTIYIYIHVSINVMCTSPHTRCTGKFSLFFYT